MEYSVDFLFTKEIINEFLERFRLELDVKKLGDFENYVFEVYLEGKPHVLRITHSSHRNEEEIMAELDWINYLHYNHVNFPKVYYSSRNHIIERIEAVDGSFFYACLFSKVKGYPVKVHTEEFNEDLFFAWGKATGHMHAITKHYQPKDGMKPRPFWYEEELLNIEKFIPDEKEVIENTNELLKTLTELPQNIDNFGLIHSDIHSSNFFYDGESIYVFDFDDCSYHWFASDIAIPLYYSIFFDRNDRSDTERQSFACHFLEHFLKGYVMHHPIPDNLLNHLPLFLRLRDITLYSVFQKKIAPRDRSEHLNLRLKEIKKRINRKEAIVKIG